MPHLDDEGFIDADPRTLKSAAVPFRDNIQIKDIPKLIEEISTIHRHIQTSKIPLWEIHKTSEGDFIQDPIFNKHQSFHGIHKKPSEIKRYLDQMLKGNAETKFNGVSDMENDNG